MPRRQFMADLATARDAQVLPAGISNVKAGEDDGFFEFTFTSSEHSAIAITAMVSDLSDYPKTHEYMLFCGENAPQDLSTAVQDARGKDRKTVFELLDIVSATLMRHVKAFHDGDTPMQDFPEDDAEHDDESYDGESDIYDSDHEAFEVPLPSHHTAMPIQGSGKSPASNRAFRQRVRSDLRAAKEAGFRVAQLGHLLDGYNSYATISIRISKLGVSEEAMKAWQVEPEEYLTLIIQYPNGYKTNEQLQAFNSHQISSNVCMRVVSGRRYKPTLQEAIKTFSILRKDRKEDRPDSETASEISSVRDTFISKPLAKLLQERLVPILRFRGIGMDWDGAEGWYQEMSTAGMTIDPNFVPNKYFETHGINNALPAVVNSDQYSQKGLKHYSFPLLAMQFMLRHFVGCTDFCLVCHRKLDTDVEAIKPYVCDDGLCLFQLLSLGFGPSIEHEIMAQPYVVDLLVSFCYNSAAARRLKSFPDGLDLMVPPIDSDNYNMTDPMQAYMARGVAPPEPATKPPKDLPTYRVAFDPSRREIIFNTALIESAGNMSANRRKKGVSHIDSCPVRLGNWIILDCEGQEGYDYHCRIAETSFFPTIRVDEPVKLRQQRGSTGGVPGQPPQTPAATRPASPAGLIPATFQIYEQYFGELSHSEKCISICRLLDTVPKVTEMREYLTARHPAELSNWSERISSHALSLLRWIIASNRSCIMQVDGNVGETDETKVEQERCSGMTGQMQFRFAMGAPDKEQRFISEVRSTTSRLSLKYPTLFAWHGSPLSNWHMIIREGLNFDHTLHGRAFGDGVYHSQDASTSLGYSAMGGNYAAGQGTWPSSVLNITNAIALNEIVNAPQEYTSQNPHLVVKQLDWIQTRYLFVKVQPTVESLKIPDVDKVPTKAHVQDPNRTPYGVGRQKIVIPATAINSGKATGSQKKESDSSMKNPHPSKRAKLFGNHTNDADDKKSKLFGIFGDAKNPIVLDDGNDSEATDEDDVSLLLDEPEDAVPVAQTVVVAKKDPWTDFVPGTLDFARLPTMPVPTYAQSVTTKRLMKELQSLQKVMDSTPSAELGWYIDTEKIENVYQWIVELHSFHTFEIKGKKLPLSEDMKKQNITSVVLEVNFNKDFPFSPPYIRVIRPQFLPFMSGGGGHVVIGGAMCMELLTNTAWSSVQTMEAVLMQVRMAIASEPFARLQPGSRGDYGTAEAAAGYIRACQTHGWEIPPGFKDMAACISRQ